MSRLRWALMALALAALSLAGFQPPQKPPPDESVRLNNRGVAYMNQQRTEQALELFERAYKRTPSLRVARLNQGIALLNLQRYEPAREILLEIARQDPQNTRAWYNLGLLYKNMGQAEAALEAFGKAAELAPTDADVHYFRASALAQLEQYEPAVAAFARALALNPFHVSAEFGLARAYQRLGEADKARQHLARFQQLTQEKLGAPMSLAYGEQGRYSLAEQVRPAAGVVGPAIPVRFVVATDEAGLAPTEKDKTARDSAEPGPGACFLDFDNDGRPDLFLVRTPAGRSALYRNLGSGRFVEAKAADKMEFKGTGINCAAGDYDNDGWTDLAVTFVGGITLWRNQGDGTFRNLAQAAGLQADGHPHGLTFLDYDHDGDLDLYVTGAHSGLWRNNGNATFTDQSAALGPGRAAGSSHVVATDFNNDRAIDLLVTDVANPPALFLNPREGAFAERDVWPNPRPGPAVGMAVFDFNKDGWMDLALTHGAEPGLTLWRNVEGTRLEPVALPDLGWTHAWGVAAFDYDNDGWLDLVAVGETAEGSEMRLLRSRGPEGFQDATTAVGLEAVKLASPRAVLTADYDADGDTDLLITQSSGGVALLRNDGGNKNNWLRISLKGLADNKSAIGTKVEVFAGALYQKWEVTGTAGGFGQSSGEIIAGLGQEKEADIVRLLWPTGVLQDEIQLAARASHPLVEIDRRGSSCPVLFAWNGSRFELISDIIGAAVVGHWVGPGQHNIPDTDEYVRVEGSRLQPRDGRLEFRFLEPMEELIYLDQVRLLAVDHPADVEVYPNERFASAPPFPPFQVVASRGARPPRRAWDDRGRDVRALLEARDRRYISDFTLLPFQGFAQLHGVELDLAGWNSPQPLRLLLHGFTEYFTATSMYAAHQAGLPVIPPYVEALTSAGRWVRVADDIGFPAGLRRTMVADLTGRLPAGTRRIRLLTNMQIYWDQILLDTTADAPPVRLSEAKLAEAELRFRGYPRQIEGHPPGDLTYNYEEVSVTGPYARHRGSYTRYGDVLPLLNAIDDQYALFGSAEEVALAFEAASLPPLPPGWRRDYFFFADGFVKDMDFYAAHSLTVAPLPFHGMGDYPYPPRHSYPGDGPHLRYQLDFNNRHLSGNQTGLYRFDYRRKENP